MIFSLEVIKPYFQYLSPSQFKGFFSDLNFGGQGILFVGLFIVFIIVWGLSLGRTRSIISVLSIYVAFTIENLFPYFENIKNSAKLPFNVYILKLCLFAGAYLVVFLIFNHSFIKRKFSSDDFSLTSIIVISILQIGLLASIAASFLPQEMAVNIFGPFYYFIGTPQTLFYWSIVPVPAVLFLGR